MANLTVDAVYGEGLFDAAADVGNIGGIGKELGELQAVFKAYPAFFALLKTPTVPAGERKAAAEKVFAGRIAEELLNFVRILIDKRRIDRLDGIAKVYERLSDERAGVTKGRIDSAVDLTEEQVKRFEEETGKLLKKRVRLHNETDASLIGGVCIYIDGKRIDASVRGRLDRLKERLI